MAEREPEAILRSAYRAFNARDIEAVIALMHPEVEWPSLVLEMEGTFHGHDGVRQW